MVYRCTFLTQMPLLEAYWPWSVFSFNSSAGPTASTLPACAGPQGGERDLDTVR